MTTAELVRSNSVSTSAPPSIAKTSANVVKSIQHVTMKTINKQIVLSTDVEKTLGDGALDGPIMGKMTKAAATVFRQMKAKDNEQAVTMTTTTVTTGMNKTITTPVPIASKPLHHPSHQPVSTNAQLLKIVSPSLVNTPQQVPSILVPASQYPNALTIIPASSIAKTPSTNQNQQAITGIRVAHITSPHQQPAPAANTPTMLTNLVIQPQSQGGAGHRVANAQILGQQPATTPPTQYLAVNQTNNNPPQRTPTHIQYILPTVTVQTGQNKNLVQMTLPGAPLNAGNLQFVQQPQAAVQGAEQPQRIMIPVNSLGQSVQQAVLTGGQAGVSDAVTRSVQILNTTPQKQVVGQGE